MRRTCGLALLLLIGCSTELEGEDAIDVPLDDYDQLASGALPNERVLEQDKSDIRIPPSSTVLLASQTGVKGQGSRGVCAIFATVALMESLYKQSGAGEPDFSEQYLEWALRKVAKIHPWTTGSGSSVK